jgi:hypothetical protein
MITIFSIPKPFVGHTGIIQENALRSWRAISDKEIILFGNEEGTEEAAEEFGCLHVKDISLSEYGTPYLDEVFKRARELSNGKYLCYVNSDIILYDEIWEAVKAVPFKEFLMTGQRWDITITTATFPNHAGILNYIMNHHTLQNFPGMDYFIFPKDMAIPMPPFIVGRRGWDNWLVYNIRSRGIPMIDATDTIHAIHQNHEYKHIPKNKGNRWEKCPESDYNLALVKNRIIYLWELDDATHRFRNGELVTKPGSERTITQGLILTAPDCMHWIMNPFYRVGHLAKYAFKRACK